MGFPHFRQSVDIRKIPDVAFQEGSDIRIKPGMPSGFRRTSLGFRIAAENESLDQAFARELGNRPVYDLSGKESVHDIPSATGNLLPGQRPKRQDLHPSSQRLRQFWKKKDIRGSRQKESTRTPIPIHFRLDGQKQIWNTLNLIDHKIPGKRGDKSLGVGLCRGQNTGIVQGKVSGFRVIPCQSLDKGALSRLSRTVQQDDGSVFQGIEDVLGNMTIIHG